MVNLVSGGGFKGTGGITGSGFRVEFEREKPGPYEAMRDQGVAVRGASVEAVVKTTNTIKERIRDYIDAHFSGSQFTRNSRRRVSNAAAQSVFYDELAEKGQYAGLVYSKFGKGHGPAGFVDYLLLHMRGGSIAPSRGNWLFIPNRNAPDARLARTGSFAGAGSSVYFVPVKGGQELLMFRSYAAGANGGKGRTRQLLATLVKNVTFPASLQGIEEIASQRPALFEGYFAAALERLQQNPQGAA